MIDLLQDYFSPRQLPVLLRSTRFWMLYSLAAMPIMLQVFDLGEEGMFFYFSLIWAFIFFRMSAPGPATLPTATIVYVAGAIIVIPFLLAFISIPPQITESMIAADSSPPVRIFGFVAGVGVREEVFKLLPIAALASMARRGTIRRPAPKQAIFYGTLSGLAFAAVENVHYLRQFDVIDAMLHARGFASQLGFAGSISRLMLTPFMHATWTGIFAYFFILGELQRSQRWAYRLAGLVGAATLHGLYDSSATLGSPIVTLAIIALTFHVFARCVGRASEVEIDTEVTVAVEPPPLALPIVVVSSGNAAE